ncbi:MAG: 50S ribosomal protein L9 [Dehalococcoidia bacterium]|nr:50S ribosomal protein L9 [Dehalococcoidia bacterium]NUQ54828.1 50S ribosomal protein L9 [Dehalococcoidia bacterium]RIL03687.1 MAG: 50S ribosomal protein L9 [bacterium]
MKVVFFEDVQGTAQVGDVKEVKNGFARNFLLPRGLAGPTTKDNLQHAQALAQKEARRQEKLDGDARKIADRLAGYTVTLEARVGESGRLFGSITNRDIAEKLHAATQLEIDPHLVLLPEPIRELGAREVTIKFTRNVTVDVTVDVQPDEESKPVVEKLLAEKKAAEAAEAKRAAEAAYAAEAAEKSARGGHEPEDAE